jgi:hypothetical protein
VCRPGCNCWGPGSLATRGRSGITRAAWAGELTRALRPALRFAPTPHAGPASSSCERYCSVIVARCARRPHTQPGMQGLARVPAPACGVGAKRRAGRRARVSSPAHAARDPRPPPFIDKLMLGGPSWAGRSPPLPARKTLFAFRCKNNLSFCCSGLCTEP